MIFSCSKQDEMAEFRALVNLHRFECTDRLDGQLEELAACLFTSEYKSGTPPADLISRHLAGRSLTSYGNWVCFPWLKKAVRLLEADDFAEVRTNRNQHKITRAEQKTLRDSAVLFIGMSVGQSSALTFAMQRICGRLILVDFDSLSLSNMNRLRASVADLGENKTVIAARHISEMDPYLDVVVYPVAAGPENLEQLILDEKNRMVDLIVEECDNLVLKMQVRLFAKLRGIPVIMETSDRGMLDVERFDENPDYPLFHGLVADDLINRLELLEDMDRKRLFNSLVDFENLSEAMKKSIADMQEKLLSWPQLASEVALGGALTTMAGMKILLGKNMQSGRYYIDIDRIFAKN